MYNVVTYHTVVFMEQETLYMSCEPSDMVYMYVRMHRLFSLFLGSNLYTAVYIYMYLAQL